MSDSQGQWADLLNIATVVVSSEHLDDTLRRGSLVAVEELEGCDMAGITLLRNGKPTTAVFTDPEAPEIDEAQYRTGIGPCLDAFRTGQIQRIPDIANETRWRPFTQAAWAHGVRSTL